MRKVVTIATVTVATIIIYKCIKSTLNLHSIVCEMYFNKFMHSMDSWKKPQI